MLQGFASRRHHALDVTSSSHLHISHPSTAITMKPFKPPSRVGSSGTLNSSRPVSSQPSEPPAKKRRITSDDEDQDVNLEASIATANLLKVQPRIVPNKFVAPARKPLQPVKVPNGSSQGETNTETPAQSYYIVVWRKYTMKKNKTWDGDGVLSVKGTYATLQDISGGREIGRGICRGPLLPGSELIQPSLSGITSTSSATDTLPLSHPLASMSSTNMSSTPCRLRSTFKSKMSNL